MDMLGIKNHISEKKSFNELISLQRHASGEIIDELEIRSIKMTQT
jgi:hypothetical protein